MQGLNGSARPHNSWRLETDRALEELEKARIVMLDAYQAVEFACAAFEHKRHAYLQRLDHSVGLRARGFRRRRTCPPTQPPCGGSPPDPSSQPADVNPPIFLEPHNFASTVPAHTLWIGVSPQGGDPNCGSALVFMSDDGGTTYRQIGTANQAAIMGTLLTSLPNHADPDTVDTLSGGPQRVGRRGQLRLPRAGRRGLQPRDGRHRADRLWRRRGRRFGQSVQPELPAPGLRQP
jgi:hypothetical protein